MSPPENFPRISADLNTFRDSELSHINSFDSSGEDMEIWREMSSINSNSNLSSILPSVSYTNYEKPDQVKEDNPGNKSTEVLGDRHQPPQNICISPRGLPVHAPGELGLVARQLLLVRVLCEFQNQASQQTP